MSNQRGVSINSIVKDAVDGWLKRQQSEVFRKHHLVIYSDDESMMRLLKSMDRLAQEGNLFRCFCGPTDNPSAELLSKLKWFDGTIHPYIFSNVGEQKQQVQQLQYQAHLIILAFCEPHYQIIKKWMDEQ